MRKLIICLLIKGFFHFSGDAQGRVENALSQDERQVNSIDECTWPFEHMGVHQAWQRLLHKGLGKPGENISVAQLDTGVIPIRSLLFTHQNSNGAVGLQLSQGSNGAIRFNLVEPLADPWDNDVNAPSFGHGTSIASLMIGWMNETGIPGLDFRGVAPWLKLIPIKVTDSVVMIGKVPTGGTADLANLAQGIHFARQMQADVITVSLGALFDEDNQLRSAVQTALESGVIVVAAAGQTFPINLIPLPARLPGVIAVSASSRDKKPWRDAFIGKHIDWAAPGDGICHIKAKMVRSSTTVSGAINSIVSIPARKRGESLSFTEELVSSSGTSYSTAYTAAAAALWLQYHSPATLKRLYGPKNISSLFEAVAKRYAMDTPENWQTQKYGSGILNIQKLIEAPLPCTEADSSVTCAAKLNDFLNFSSR